MSKAPKGIKRSGGGPERGLHRMESGLIHTADSLAGGPRGTFIDKYGPPGDPTHKSSHAADKGFTGKQPHLLTGLAGNKRKGL